MLGPLALSPTKPFSCGTDCSSLASAGLWPVGALLVLTGSVITLLAPSAAEHAHHLPPSDLAASPTSGCGSQQQIALRSQSAAVLVLSAPWMDGHALIVGFRVKVLGFTS